MVIIVLFFLNKNMVAVTRPATDWLVPERHENPVKL